jgi:hypothetical protein
MTSPLHDKEVALKLNTEDTRSDATLIGFPGNHRELTAARATLLPHLAATNTSVDSAHASTIDAVIASVAECTGYHPTAIDPELDLENVLGIDNAQRTRIAAHLAAVLACHSPDTPLLTPHEHQAIGRMRTVSAIALWLSERLALAPDFEPTLDAVVDLPA